MSGNLPGLLPLHATSNFEGAFAQISPPRYSQLIAILAGQDPLALPDHVALAVLKCFGIFTWLTFTF